MSKQSIAEAPGEMAGDMPAAEFHHYGGRVVDWIADYLREPRRFKVASKYAPGDLISKMPTRGPETGESFETIWQEFERDILAGVTFWNHPHFHAYFSISSSGPGIIGEMLMAAIDANAMLWKSCPAATELEQVTTGWVLDWLELPRQWFGMIVDSASNGVLQAIIAARHRAEPQCRRLGPSGRLVAYVSEHTHCSVEKAVIAAGIGQENVRHIPVDPEFAMCPDPLNQAIVHDQQRGLNPFFVAATVGTTSSAAVDCVPRIADICEESSVWLHVDGAYGGSFGLVPEYRGLLDGVQRADSFVVNPHKLMMVPLDCSLFYTAHPDVLRSAFSLETEYLKTNVANATDYMDYGLALGRRFRALKLWLVMRYFGREGIAEMLRKNVRLANWLVQKISADSRLELAAPANLGLVCFRTREGDAATRELMRRLNESGDSFVSHTVLGGKLTIRIAIGNIRTQQEDVEGLWKQMGEAMQNV